MARPSDTWILVSGDDRCTVPPAATTFSAQTSHIMPGPSFGYWNSSMRLVISVCLRLGNRALITALRRSRFLMRCAAQSDGICDTFTPHTFSVYVLKKVR